MFGWRRRDEIEALRWQIEMLAPLHVRVGLLEDRVRALQAEIDRRDGRERVR